VPGAHVIDALSYDEMRELAFFGVRLLHPRAIDPVSQRRIPLRVRNPFNIDHGGSLIQVEPSPQGLRAVSAVDGFMLTYPGMMDLQQLLPQLTNAVGQAAVGPVIAVQSQRLSSAVFVIPTSEGQGAVNAILERVRAGLHSGGFTLQAVKVIAVLGGRPGLNAALSTRPIAYAQGPGDRSLFAVLPEETSNAVRQLHRLITT
jgi:aspartate kinase